jgi:predicted naringenin-chalcone synthase
MLVTAQPAGIAMLDFLALIIPDSSDLITWHIGDQGFNMHLSGQVPQRIKQTLREDMDQAGANRILRGAQVKDYDLWAIHPGGRSVLDAVETGLGLAAADLSSSRRILFNYGNMSSATIMFVLQDMLRQFHRQHHQHHQEARGRAVDHSFVPDNHQSWHRQ